MKKMTKRLFGLVMAGVMMLSLAISVSAAQQDPFDYYNDFTIEKNGCIVRDDVVYDRDGEVLFTLNDGFTADGCTLSPDFQVHYDAQTITDPSHSLTRDMTIFRGRLRVNQNVNGTEGVPCGGQFSLTSDEPCISIQNNSGDCAVNISLNNITNNRWEDYFPTVEPGTGYTSESEYISDDIVYTLTASGAGGYGWVNLTIKRVAG